MEKERKTRQENMRIKVSLLTEEIDDEIKTIIKIEVKNVINFSYKYFESTLEIGEKINKICNNILFKKKNSCLCCKIFIKFKYLPIASTFVIICHGK